MAELCKDGSSDDEVYNNVDLISDSDEDDPTVEEVEERDIIESEEGRARRAPPAPSSPSSPGDEWDGFEIDHDDGGHPDSAFTRINPHFASEIEMFQAASTYDRAASTPVSESKRVRFQLDSDVAQSVSSSSSSSDSNRGRFQNLFMQQDQLDSQFRQMIENDQDDEESSDSSGYGSRYNSQYHGDLGLGVDYEDDSRSETSVGSLSGYETDEGETTDEDLPPPQSIARTRSVLRSASTSSDSDDEEYRTAALSTPRNRSSSRRIGPSLGSWIADPSKPIAVIDSTGKRMVVYPALRPNHDGVNISGAPSSASSTVNSSPQTSCISRLADFDVVPSPLIGTNAPFLTGSLLRGHGENEIYYQDHELSSSSAFLPFLTGPFGDTTNFFDDDDDGGDDGEQMLNVEDFIDFGDDSSSEDDANGNAASLDDLVSPTTSVPRPGSSSQATSTDHDGASSSDTVTQRMLEHFDRGVVTAFRQNQAHQKLLFSNPPPHDYPIEIKKAISKTNPFPMKPPSINGSRSSKRSLSQSSGSTTSTATLKRMNYSEGHNGQKRRKMNAF